MFSFIACNIRLTKLKNGLTFEEVTGYDEQGSGCCSTQDAKAGHAQMKAKKVLIHQRPGA